MVRQGVTLVPAVAADPATLSISPLLALSGELAQASDAAASPDSYVGPESTQPAPAALTASDASGLLRAKAQAVVLPRLSDLEGMGNTTFRFMAALGGRLGSQEVQLVRDRAGWEAAAQWNKAFMAIQANAASPLLFLAHPVDPSKAGYSSHSVIWQLLGLLRKDGAGKDGALSEIGRGFITSAQDGAVTVYDFGGPIFQPSGALTSAAEGIRNLFARQLDLRVQFPQSNPYNTLI